MLFKRRVSAGFGERVRTYVWPRRSFMRSVKYFLKRILRLNATPHAVAAGVAAGVFASFFPLGLHFVIAAAVSWIIAGNLVAAALGTVVGNPLTFPFLWAAAWETGRLILHGSVPPHGAPHNLGAMMEHLSFRELWDPVLKPMTVGAIPLGLASGLVAYGLTRWGMTVFRRQRARRLADRHADRARMMREALGPHGTAKP